VVKILSVFVSKLNKFYTPWSEVAMLMRTRHCNLLW